MKQGEEHLQDIQLYISLAELKFHFFICHFQ